MLVVHLSRLVGFRHFVIQGTCDHFWSHCDFHNFQVYVHTLNVHSGSWYLGVEVSDVIKYSKAHRIETPNKELSVLGLKMQPWVKVSCCC